MGWWNCFCTGRYIKDDSVRAKGIKWDWAWHGGEDIKTGGSFPDWKCPILLLSRTRGNDKHTEWGAVLKESDMFPHYFNDLLLNRCLKEAKIPAGWLIPQPVWRRQIIHLFLRAHIPGLVDVAFYRCILSYRWWPYWYGVRRRNETCWHQCPGYRCCLPMPNDKLITALIDDITGNAIATFANGSCFKCCDRR